MKKNNDLYEEDLMNLELDLQNLITKINDLSKDESVIFYARRKNLSDSMCLLSTGFNLEELAKLFLSICIYEKQLGKILIASVFAIEPELTGKITLRETAKYLSTLLDNNDTV